MMGFGPAVVPGGAVTVGQLDRQPAADERFEALVHGGQRDSGQVLSHCEEDLISGGMDVGTSNEPVDGGALLGEPQTTGLEGLS